MTRKEQKEARRLQILQTSLDLFVKRSYSETKISDIASANNMSVGLLFHYFESKEVLYEELIKIGLAGTKSVMVIDKTNPLTFFETVVTSIFLQIKQNPITAKMFVLMEQALHNESVSENVKALLSQLDNIASSVPLIEQGQRQGVMKSGDPLALSILFWCAIQGVAQDLALYPEHPCPKVEWMLAILKK